jgi:hypothetical protein
LREQIKILLRRIDITDKKRAKLSIDICSSNGKQQVKITKNKVRTGDACVSAGIPGNIPVFPPWV